MNQRDLELLLALKQTNNITKAAQLLFISQPALTHRVTALEKELGVSLFTRSNRGIQFTTMGERVLAAAESIIGQIEELHNYINIHKGMVDGTLHIGVPVDYARWKVSALLERYAMNYPMVSLSVVTGISSRLYQRLLRKEIDFSIIRGEYAWSEEKFLISEEPVCLACSNREARQKLSELRFIHRSTDDLLTAQIQQWLGENGISITPMLHVDDIDTCKKLVHANAWMIAPQLPLEAFNGYIEPLYFANGEPIVRRTYILCRSSYMGLLQVKKFVEMLIPPESSVNSNKKES